MGAIAGGAFCCPFLAAAVCAEPVFPIATENRAAQAIARADGDILPRVQQDSGPNRTVYTQESMGRIPGKHFLRNLVERRALVAQLVRRDFETRYKGSAAGWLWGVVHPLVMLASYAFVFQI